MPILSKFEARGVRKVTIGIKVSPSFLLVQTMKKRARAEGVNEMKMKEIKEVVSSMKDKGFLVLKTVKSATYAKTTPS